MINKINDIEFTMYSSPLQDIRGAFLSFWENNAMSKRFHSHLHSGRLARVGIEKKLPRMQL